MEADRFDAPAAAIERYEDQSFRVLAYKGHSATVSYDNEDRIYTGRLAGVNDVVGFHADTEAEIERAFHEAVDDYLSTRRKLGKEPQLRP